MNSGASRTCESCGQELSASEACERCARRNAFRLVRREFTILIVLALISIGFYIGTRRLADSNREMKIKVAAIWYEQGQEQMAQGDASAAVAAFRKAIFNDFSNRNYAPALVHALESSGRVSEAEELLLRLRETSPENPEINLDLARIAAKQDNLSNAVRYYHNTLYGIWTGDNADKQKQAIRRELIEFLIENGAKNQALAEVSALATSLPETPETNLEIGRYFVRAGDTARGLQYFLETLHKEPHNPGALNEAGNAAFELEDYALARRALSELSSRDPSSEKLLRLATLIVEMDPLDRRLSLAERSRRLREDLDQATNRLKSCLSHLLPTAEPQTLATLKTLHDDLDAQRKGITQSGLWNDPDIMLATLNLIYAAEQGASKSCGPLPESDSALLLLAKKVKGTES